VVDIYLIGIAIALLALLFHAPANILDSYFSNRLFKELTALIFVSCALNILFLPLVLFFGMPAWVPTALWPVLLLLSCIDVFWLYPYYWALRRTDTSIAVSLFSIGNLFVPMLAFLIVGERLSSLQYIGFFAIVLSSIALTFDRRHMKPNAALVSMAAVSLLFAFCSVLEKYLFVHGMTFPTLIIWTGLLQIAISGAFFAVTRTRGERAFAGRQRASTFAAVFLMQLLTWLGDSMHSYATYLIPVSVVVGIVAMQPLIALGYAILFER
jgi:drug/metabolite transporter (DMT)-like permease